MAGTGTEDLSPSVPWSIQGMAWVTWRSTPPIRGAAGTSRHGLAWLGGVELGVARHGKAGTTWHGRAWTGRSWHGLERRGGEGWGGLIPPLFYQLILVASRPTPAPRDAPMRRSLDDVDRLSGDVVDSQTPSAVDPDTIARFAHLFRPAMWTICSASCHWSPGESRRRASSLTLYPSGCDGRLN